MNWNKTLFICFSFIIFGCGKKVENSQNSSDTQRQTATSADIPFNFSFESDKSTELGYTFSRDGWVSIPDKFNITSGDSLIITTRIYFNQDDQESSKFHCRFNSVKQISDKKQNLAPIYTHQFKGCYDDVNNDGILEEVYYLPGEQVPMNKSEKVVLKVRATSSTSKINMETALKVDWY